MPDPWYPKARRHLGIRAGYASGRNRMNSIKCHYTAGYSSEDLIANRGLAQFLVTRAGEVVQFCEVDAYCIDSGEWNDDGPGIEVEAAPQYGEDIFTPEAYAATAELCQWLHDEWGKRLEYYDDPDHRIPEGSWDAFISHRSLIQSEPHGDYWPELPRLDVPAPTPRSFNMAILARSAKASFLIHEGREVGITPDQWNQWANRPDVFVFDGLSDEQIGALVYPPKPAVGNVTVDFPTFKVVPQQ